MVGVESVDVRATLREVGEKERRKLVEDRLKESEVARGSLRWGYISHIRVLICLIKPNF